MKSKLIFLLIAAACFFQSGSRISASSQIERIRFHVTVVTDSTAAGKSGGENRNILSKTTIDGPAGTDFNINLNTGGFEMKSKFLTELVAEGELLVRVNLETRRLFGKSPNNLPLYEEDKQKQSLNMGFDESVVLLPYGRNGGGQTLKIEIEPERYDVSQNDKEAGRLFIDFQKELESGEISIEARKVPHRYDVEAVLLKDGKVVGQSTAEALLEETKAIKIVPNKTAPKELQGKIITASIAVDGYIGGRPRDLVSISFDVSDEDGPNANGKGMQVLGGDLTYPLNKRMKDYEIRFRVTERKE